MTVIEGLIAADSLNALPYLLKAEAYYSLDEIDRSLEMFDKAEELHPGYADSATVLFYREQLWIIRYNEALEVLNGGDQDEAFLRFQETNEIFRRRPEVLFTLGALHYARGESGEAIGAYRQGLRVIEEHSEGRDSLTLAAWDENAGVIEGRLNAIFLDLERYDEAIAMNREILASDPNDHVTQLRLASVYQMAGQPDSAAALYDRVFRRADLTTLDYYSAGVGFFRVEDFARAAEAFREVVKRNPKMRDGHYMLATCLFQAEEWSELRPVAQALIGLDSHNRVARDFLAQAYANVGDTARAMSVLEESGNLPFEVQGAQLQSRITGGGALNGEILNHSLEEGAEVRLRIHFVGKDGMELGAIEVTVQAPAVDGTQSFSAELASEDVVEGYWYEVL